MANNKASLRVRWLAGTAGRIAAAAGDKSAVEVLQAIQDAIFQQDISNGKILIGNTEAGGSVSFTIPQGHTPMEIGDLAQQAIDYLNGARMIKRFRASFANAHVS